jgi:hypothetical protein
MTSGFFLYFKQFSSNRRQSDIAVTMSFDEKEILNLDPWLEPFVPAIAHRYQCFKKWKDTIQEHEGGYDSFTKGYLKYGFNVNEDASITYREWAPNAVEAVLIGDFSSSPAQSRLSSWFIKFITIHRRMEPDLSCFEEEPVRCLGDYYSSPISGCLRYSSRLQGQGQ